MQKEKADISWQELLELQEKNGDCLRRIISMTEFAGKEDTSGSPLYLTKQVENLIDSLHIIRTHHIALEARVNEIRQHEKQRDKAKKQEERDRGDTVDSEVATPRGQKERKPQPKEGDPQNSFDDETHSIRSKERKDSLKTVPQSAEKKKTKKAKRK